MLKTRVKIINIEAYDKDNIENMLNTAASDGWELQSINRYYCTFKKTSAPRKYYYVLHNYSYYSKTMFHEFLVEQKELEKYLEEFDYSLINTVKMFEIYVSENNAPIYTELYLNKNKERLIRKSVKKSLILQSILICIMILALISIGLKKSSIYEVIAHNESMIDLLLLLLLAITVLPRKIILKIKYLTNKDNYHSKIWNTYRNCPSQVYSSIVWISMIAILIIGQTGIYNSSGYDSLIYDTKGNLEEERNVDLLQIPYLKEKLKHESKSIDRYSGQRESVLITDVFLHDNNQHTFIIYSKQEVLNDLVFEQYLLSEDIEYEEVEEDRMISVDKGYIYKYKNILLYSQKQINRDLIEDTKVFINNY